MNRKLIIVAILLIGGIILGKILPGLKTKKVEVKDPKLEVFNASPSEARVIMESQYRIDPSLEIKGKVLCDPKNMHPFCHIFRIPLRAEGSTVELEPKMIVARIDSTELLKKARALNATQSLQENFQIVMAMILKDFVNENTIQYLSTQQINLRLESKEGGKVKDSVFIPILPGRFSELYELNKKEYDDFLQKKDKEFFTKLAVHHRMMPLVDNGKMLVDLDAVIKKYEATKKEEAPQ